MSDSAPPRDNAARKRALGMGLSALFGAEAPGEGALAAGTGAPQALPVEFLNPSPLQPRRRFDQEELEQLAASIRAKGVMQPLLVRPQAGGYEIVAGERRWRAAQMAGLHELPVIVLELDDRAVLEVGLLENVQRQDLGPLEEAEGYRRLIEDFGHSQDELSRVLGKSRSHIANHLRLLHLPDGVRTRLEAGHLSTGHARALLPAPDPAAIAEEVHKHGLNVRQTERLVRKAIAQAAKPDRSRGRAVDANIAALERRISGTLGLAVALKPKGRGGTLSISYGSLDQLDALLRRLT